MKRKHREVLRQLYTVTEWHVSATKRRHTQDPHILSVYMKF